MSDREKFMNDLDQIAEQIIDLAKNYDIEDFNYLVMATNQDGAEIVFENYTDGRLSELGRLFKMRGEDYSEYARTLEQKNLSSNGRKKERKGSQEND